MKKNRLMDSNKILYHEDWLKQWEKDPFGCYPLYIEISPVGACNDRCTFCAVDYIGYVNIRLPSDLLALRLREMGSLGVKSVMFAGEGEPSLHRDFSRLCIEAKEGGLDVAITTNGSGLNAKFAEAALWAVTWIKVSLDAATAETHAAIHKANPKQFPKRIKNLEEVVRIRNEMGWDCDIGGQMILLPENWKEAVDFVKLLKNIGVDYAAFKPYSQHPKSLNREETILGHFRYEEKLLEELKVELVEAAEGEIDVEFRINTMLDYESSDRGYNQCFSTPTAWASLMSNGDIYSCTAYLKDERFRLGNINEETFEAIWTGEKRRKHLNWVLNHLDISECRKNCRMNSVNKTLWASRVEPERFEAEKKLTETGVLPDNLNFI